LEVSSAPSESDEEREERVARLVLEDLVATLLLSRGRRVKSAEVTGSAEGLAPTRAGLRFALSGSSLVEPREREWELLLRERSKGVPREERGRAPLESTLKSLLVEVGKPLPLPVLVREAAPLRGVLPETIRELIASTLKTARWAVEVRESTYAPLDLMLTVGAPTAPVLIRHNALAQDPDFDLVEALDVKLSGDLAARAAQVLEAVGQPISLKLLGYALWRGDSSMDARALARAVGDRARFYWFAGGAVTTVDALAALRANVDAWLAEKTGGGAGAVDVGAILRQRLLPAQIIAPTPEQVEEVRSFAANAGGNSFSIGTVLSDVLEVEPDDALFAPRLQGLNDALRRDQSFLPAGIGRYLLRAAVPESVGQVPERLLPITLASVDSGNEPVDVEMSDEGLEGDAAAFVHDPQWEDISEEVEVRLHRRADEAEPEVRMVVLNHHFEAGTLKLRRVDEEFFAVEGAFARVNLRAHGEERAEMLAAWAARDSGILYNLGPWMQERLPRSGGVLLFSRDPQALPTAPIDLRILEADEATFIDDDRAEVLEEMRHSASYLSLFELLQNIAGAHGGGATLPTLWAEVNMVRRTTKRALCSILSAYNCFGFRQRGPHQFLWRFDAGKLDQGFKKNKRKFVRR
jgi:hypothetical protein